jgi:hypothetical protein
MLPYAGTQIEQQLIAAGKIKGAVGEEDYDFNDPIVTRVHDHLNDIFYDWVGTREGLLNASRWMRYELAVSLRIASTQQRLQTDHLRSEANQVIASANNFLIDIAEKILDLASRPIPSNVIALMKKTVHQKHDEFTQSLESIAHQLAKQL